MPEIEMISELDALSIWINERIIRLRSIEAQLHQRLNLPYVSLVDKQEDLKNLISAIKEDSTLIQVQVKIGKIKHLRIGRFHPEFKKMKGETECQPIGKSS